MIAIPSGKHRDSGLANVFRTEALAEGSIANSSGAPASFGLPGSAFLRYARAAAGHRPYVRMDIE